MPSTRPLSQLRYVRVRESDAYHAAQTQPVWRWHSHARAVAPEARILGLESFKGIFVSRDVVGYTWYVGPIDRPAPVFFGDSLAEIERFLWDFLDRQETAKPERPFLLGMEQGAIMAIAAALASPDLLLGVIAVDGALPLVPGWEPPLAPLDGLPILLVGDLAVLSGEPLLRSTELASQLVRWGGAADHIDTTIALNREFVIRNWLASQPVLFGYPLPNQ